MRRSAIPDPFEGESLGELFGEPGERVRGDHFEPAVDVFETDAAIVVRAEIPGLRGEDLTVRIDADLLYISGVRNVPREQDVQRLHRMEIAFGPFERSIRIQTPFEREKVSAHLEDGFLRVVLPKTVPVRRKVEIEGSVGNE